MVEDLTKQELDRVQGSTDVDLSFAVRSNCDALSCGHLLDHAKEQYFALPKAHLIVGLLSHRQLLLHAPFDALGLLLGEAFNLLYEARVEFYDFRVSWYPRVLAEQI